MSWWNTSGLQEKMIELIQIFRAYITLSQVLLRNDEDNCFDLIICLFSTNNIMFSSKSRWLGIYVFRLNRWKGGKTLQWGQGKNSFWLTCNETIFWRGKKITTKLNFFFFFNKIKLNLFELSYYRSSNLICSAFYGWVLTLNISVLFGTIRRQLCWWSVMIKCCLFINSLFCLLNFCTEIFTEA